MKKHFTLFLFIFLTTSFSTAQTYVEISVDTSEHFNIAMEPGEVYYYSTLSGCAQPPISTLLGFFDVDDEIIDFLEVEIDDVILVGIVTGPSGILYIYRIKFNMSLKSNAPLSGTIDDVSMVSIFLNGSGSVIGGYIRSNMSLTIGTSSVAGADAQAPTITCYPNPTSDVIHVEHSGNQALGLIEIYSSDGKRVAVEDAPSHEHTLNIQGLPAGIYQLKMQIGNRLFCHTILKAD